MHFETCFLSGSTTVYNSDLFFLPFSFFFFALHPPVLTSLSGISQTYSCVMVNFFFFLNNFSSEVVVSV